LKPGAALLVQFRRREWLIAATVSLATSAVLVAAGPAPGDAPAYLYRTLLARQDAFVWDNFWYAGHYPVGYSLLYYPLSALVGNLTLGLAAAACSAALFASVCVREWGRAGRWPGIAFGLLSAAPLFTGLFTYALGLASLLGCVRALQVGRRWLAIALLVLTAAFSPLAFVFLCVVLVAIAISRRPVLRRYAPVVAALAIVGSAEIALAVLFPLGGVYPYSVWDLVAGLAVCALGVAIARRAPRAAALQAVLLVWAVAIVGVFVAPSPIGDNITRLRGLVFPVVLLAAALARFRPRWLAVPALAAALAYNVVPYLMLIPYRADPRPEAVAFWRPALGFLEQHRSADFRVEVVPTANHWESYWLPRARFALARGWYRQLDIVRSPELYQSTLSPPAYRGWLHRLAVRYVLLPNTALDPRGGPAERDLLRSGRSGLVEVATAGAWTVYQVPDPTPILSGPGGAELTVLGHELVAGRVTAPGTYRLRIAYTPYWHVRTGAVCIAQTADGMTRLVAERPGAFSLAVSNDPLELVEARLDLDDSARCPTPD
jgi:hypothetical protein